jgi:hypothetical protein
VCGIHAYPVCRRPERRITCPFKRVVGDTHGAMYCHVVGRTFGLELSRTVDFRRVVCELEPASSMNFQEYCGRLALCVYCMYLLFVFLLLCFYSSL